MKRNPIEISFHSNKQKFHVKEKDQKWVETKN